MHRARLRVRFRGVRGSIPSPGPDTAAVGGNTSCVEVSVAGLPPVFIDAGTGLRGAPLPEAGSSLILLLSHFHWDHLQGLPFLPELLRRDGRVDIHAAYAPDRLEAALATQMSAPFFPIPWAEVPACVRLHQLSPDGGRLHGIDLAAFPLNHPQGCSGFELQANGTRVVYASDFEFGNPAFDEILVERASGADLLIADAQHTPDEQAGRRGWGHSSWLDATEVARRASVGQLALFHHDPARTDAAVASILSQARDRFERKLVATEGLVIDI